ncbi:MAG TPA: hypothetical protein VHN11_11580 [Xanthobacteraceae bacterium]|jgi:hypothetical protein|nr:hypothetical protein [Xanthobacteraceae bacterium]
MARVIHFSRSALSAFIAFFVIATPYANARGGRDGVHGSMQNRSAFPAHGRSHIDAQAFLGKWKKHHGHKHTGAAIPVMTAQLGSTIMSAFAQQQFCVDDRAVFIETATLFQNELSAFADCNNDTRRLPVRLTPEITGKQRTEIRNLFDQKSADLTDAAPNDIIESEVDVSANNIKAHNSAADSVVSETLASDIKHASVAFGHGAIAAAKTISAAASSAMRMIVEFLNSLF